MLRCIIVDDEPLALNLLADYVDKIPFLQRVALCSDAFDAARVLQETPVDLMFIDVQMPGLTGFQFIQSLARKPMVIIVTAYKKFAHEGYELDVVDYLVKPVGLERFMKACNKAQELYQLRNSAGAGTTAPPAASKTTQTSSPGTAPALAPPMANPDFFFLNVDYSMLKILFSDIMWIEGSGDYVKIHLKSAAKPLLVRMSTRAMEGELPADRFIRIHKSYIIAVESITAIRKNSVFIKDLELPIGETYREVIGALTGKKQ